MSLDEMSKWESVYAEAELPPVGAERGTIYREVAEYVTRALPEGAVRSSLECGCGSGLHSLALAGHGIEVSLLDFSAAALTLAQRLFARAGVEAQFHHGDVFENDQLGPFDLVFNSGVLEHYSYEEQVRFVQALARRSKKYVLILVPNRDCYWYWVWRIRLQSRSEWPYGFEKPAKDYAPVFADAGVHLIHKSYYGTEWIDSFVQSLALPSELASIISRLHSEAVVDISSRAYLVGFLGEVKPPGSTAYISDMQTGAREGSTLADREDRAIALAADALSAIIQVESRSRLDREREIGRLTQLVAERDNRAAELSRLLEEREEQVNDLSRALDVMEHKVAATQHQAVAMEQRVGELLSSTSWKLTRPVRLLRRLTRDPVGTSTEVARRILIHPVSGQIRLGASMFRSGVLGWPGDPNANTRQNPPSVRRRITSWREFDAEVLARRGQFKGVFIQSTVIPWNVPLYQRPQHIATALGKLGYLVIYRTQSTFEGRDMQVAEEIEENVWLTGFSKVDELKPVITSYYSTSHWHTEEEYSASARNGMVLYEYIDHIDPAISGSQHVARLQQLRDFAFAGGAHVIVASARVLEVEARRAIDRADPGAVIYIPNGVDSSHYESALRVVKRRRLPRKYKKFLASYGCIVGYFGALAPWLWYPVLGELAAERPDLGFVFIGPDYLGGAACLPVSDNVIWLGPVAYDALPAYASEFDVAIIPFVPGEIAKTTSPLKLFEYFALGKPVVVTSDMAECVVYEEVLSASSSREFAAGIDRAVVLAGDQGFKERLQALAKRHDWISRARQLEPVFGRVEERFKSDPNEAFADNTGRFPQSS